MATPVERLEKARAENELVIVAFYRGLWCPICQSWVSMWVRQNPDFAADLKALKAKFLFVVSQPQEDADRAGQKWKMLTDELVAAGVEFVGDPENTIPAKLQSDGLLSVVIQGAGKPYSTHGHTYPVGMAQPALVAVKKGCKLPLYRWELQPTTMNLGGATDRPLPGHIWEYIKSANAGDTEKPLPRGKTAVYMREACVIA